MKYLLFLIVSFLYVIPTFGQQIFTQTAVYFDTDKYSLTVASETSLSKFITLLEQINDDYEIILEAHTDGQGSQAYNTVLAQKRATSVEVYLQNKGINAANISIAVFGEDNPSFSNNGNINRSKNRRVDIKAITIESKTSELEVFLTAESQKRTQQFIINSNEKNLIIGRSGTKVYIDENTFIFENGGIPKVEEIRLSMKEAYTFEDMMIFQLSTHSKNNLLETGGMVFLEATAQGQKLKVKDGKSIKIGLPTSKRKEEMQLFSGVENGNSVEWNATNQIASIAPFEYSYPITPEVPFSRITYFIKENFERTPVLNKEQHKYYKSRISELMLYIELVEPQKPSKPKQPELEQVYFEKNLKSFFTSKKKINRELQNKYERRLKVYNRKMKQYEIDLENYKIDSFYFPKWIVYQKQMINIASGKFMEEFDTEFKTTGGTSKKKLQNYFFNSNKLGWINCDRFYLVPEEQKQILTINDRDNEDEIIYVILKDRNSCIKVNRYNKKTFTTGLVPKETVVTIVGLKIKDGKNYIAKHETVVNSKINHDLSYQAVSSLDKLKNLLSL